MNRGLRLALSATLALPFAAAPLAGNEVVVRAMKDEMARSMAELQLEDLPKPYFLSYTVFDRSTFRVIAELGGVVTRREQPERILSVEIRVGDHNLDNTNFSGRPGPGLGGLSVLPLKDDYNEIRRAIWLATDSAYKRALDMLSRKQAALQNQTVVDRSADFSDAETVQHEGAPSPEEIDVAELEGLAKRLSGTYAGIPAIHVSSVEIEAGHGRTLYLNSEGSSFDVDRSDVWLTTTAGTRASDGEEISDGFTVFGSTAADLPNAADLINRIQELGNQLTALREAPILDRYAGPVLFEGQAAGQLVRSVLLPRLLVGKTPVGERTRPGQPPISSQGNPFHDKLGSRILPRDLDIVDNPSAESHDGTALRGGFAVDDEGVPAQETELVRRGILKTLLSTRSPIEGVEQSNGHSRGGGPAPSNLFLVPTDGLSDEELTEELMALVEERELEYGLIVSRVSESSTNAFATRTATRRRGSPLVRAVVAAKVYPDGRRELVRSAALSGVSAETFRDIVAASEVQNSFTFRFRARPVGFGFSFASRIGSPASLVVPALLFEDISASRPPDSLPRLPVVPPPSAD